MGSVVNAPSSKDLGAGSACEVLGVGVEEGVNEGVDEGVDGLEGVEVEGVSTTVRPLGIGEVSPILPSTILTVEGRGSFGVVVCVLVLVEGATGFALTNVDPLILGSPLSIILAVVGTVEVEVEVEVELVLEVEVGVEVEVEVDEAGVVEVDVIRELPVEDVVVDLVGEVEDEVEAGCV